MRLRDHLLRRDVAYRTCSRGPGFGDGFRAGHRHAVSVTATTSSAGTSRIALAAAATVSETASAPATVTPYPSPRPPPPPGRPVSHLRPRPPFRRRLPRRPRSRKRSASRREPRCYDPNPTPAASQTPPLCPVRRAVGSHPMPLAHKAAAVASTCLVSVAVTDSETDAVSVTAADLRTGVIHYPVTTAIRGLGKRTCRRLSWRAVVLAPRRNETTPPGVIGPDSDS